MGEVDFYCNACGKCCNAAAEVRCLTCVGKRPQLTPRSMRVAASGIVADGGNKALLVLGNVNSVDTVRIERQVRRYLCCCGKRMFISPCGVDAAFST
jgi:hypothetical protein